MVVAAVAPMFHLPPSGVVLVLAIDQILDMGRTATNVIGNSIATAVIAKWEVRRAARQAALLTEAATFEPASEAKRNDERRQSDRASEVFGVMGGLGPLASADVLLQADQVDARRDDAEHFDVVFEQHPFRSFRCRQRAVTQRKLYIFDMMRGFEKRGVDDGRTAVLSEPHLHRTN